MVAEDIGQEIDSAICDIETMCIESSECSVCGEEMLYNDVEPPQFCSQECKKKNV